MQYLMLAAVTVAITMIIVGITIKPYKINRVLNNEDGVIKKTILQNIADKCIELPLVGRSAKWLALRRSNSLIKLSNKVLELSELTLSLHQLYALKLASSLIAFMIIASINITNVQYQKEYIIEDSVTDIKGEWQEASIINKLQPDSRNKLYEDIELLDQNNNEEILTFSIMQSFGVNNATAILYEDWYQQVKEKIDNLKIFSLSDFMLVLVAVFAWDILLLIIWILRGYVCKQEIIRLEHVFQQLSGIEGVRTTEIIEELVAASKVYKKQLRCFYQNFICDKRQAFEALKNSGGSISLCKLAEVLEIYSLNDHEVAIEILDRVILERDEAALITAEETLDLVDIFAFISIAPLVYEIARLMLSPMLELIYKAFEFV